MKTISKRNQKNQKQKSDAQKKQDPQKQNDNAEKNPQSDQPDKKEEQKPQPGESAFGDMSKKDDQPPPPPPQDTQKVGGEKQEQPKEPIDPSLALPLQKLDQLRNQDSPAQLFQLMEVDKKPTKKSGKNW